jgi:2-polyprenyl-6-methoxyphenol hydroxylase-like FAD-dependent oxidoreductase
MALSGPILVVGGGIGGMSAALALSRAGCEVEIVELDPNWRALGAGLTLNGGALRALDNLDLLKPVLDAGYTSTGPVRTFDANGNLLGEGPTESMFGAHIPNIGGILRPKLHEVIRDRVLAAGIKVRAGVSVEDLQEIDGMVCATTTDGRQGRYQLVIGADGLLSHIRETIFPSAPRPAFTGQGCWRAVVPRPSDVTATMVYFGDRAKAGFNPISDDQMYVYLLESQPGNPWIVEADWLGEMRAKLEPYHGHFDPIREGLGPDSQINYRPLEVIMLTDPWHVGHVLLIGDAAHATTPHVGYGAGLAIEDAVVLGELASICDSVDDLLHKFMERRFERCRTILEGSVQLGELEMAGASVAEQRALSGRLNMVIRQDI